MSTFHISSRPACRPKSLSLALLLFLFLTTVLPSAVAPASATSTRPTAFHIGEIEGERTDNPTQSGILTDSTTSTPPSSTALKAAPAMLYESGTNVTMFRWYSSGTSFGRYGSHWTVPSGYALSRVGNRMVSGDFNGDGTDDIATAYDYDTYFRLHVWLGGVTWQGSSGWYEGILNLDNVQGRLVAGDWDGDGRDDLALGYDYGGNTARIYRYRSTGSSFSHMAGDWVSNDGAYAFSRVNDRMVSGDFNNDGRDDIATAYSYTGPYFRFHVWLDGVTYWSSWYESGSYDLARDEGRMVAGDWNGDGRADLALGHDYGNNSARIVRFTSTGSSFSHTANDWSVSSGYAFSRVGDRMAAGDVNGDGLDDIAVAYSYSPSFRFHVWLSGATYRGSTGWYESTLDLDNVQGRFVLGRW